MQAENISSKKNNDLKDRVWRCCRPVENTAAHPSPSAAHTNAHRSAHGRACGPFEQLLAEMLSLSLAEDVSEHRPPIQTAEVKSAREEYGCYTSLLTWQQEQSVLSGLMVFKYKLSQLLFRFVRIYQGAEFSEGSYNPEKDMWTEGDCVYSTRLS